MMDHGREVWVSVCVCVGEIMGGVVDTGKEPGTYRADLVAAEGAGALGEVGVARVLAQGAHHLRLVVIAEEDGAEVL